MAGFKLGHKLVQGIHNLDAEGVALHPHQRRRLVLFGILIAFLSFVVSFTVIHGERKSQSDLLRKVGASPMTSFDLKSEISNLRIAYRPYWLGAITGMKYEANTSDSHEIVIRYIQSAADPSINGTNIYTVESYENEAMYNEDVNAQDFSTDAEFVSKGRTIRYLSKTMAFLTVRISGIHEVFEIHCSQAQTLFQLDELAQSLTPLS